jgi:anti-sigma factor ChrR (cupin superfamily)
MTDILTREEAAFLDNIVAESIEPVAPPPSVKARLMSLVRDIPQNSRTVRASEGRWNNFAAPGVKVKLLTVDEEHDTATMLMEFAPGAVCPAHDHQGSEQSFVVRGSCRIGGVHLQQGDFHHAERGSHHADVVSDEGCVLLLVVDKADACAA